MTSNKGASLMEAGHERIWGLLVMTTIQFRRGTDAEWVAANPVLAD